MFLKIKEYFVLFIYTLVLICRISLKDFLFTIGVSCLSGFLPFIVLIINQRLINELQLMQKPLNIIIQLVIVYFLISVIQNIFQNISNYNLNRLNNITQYGINKILIEKCGKLSLEMLERTETYDTITRLEQEIAIKPYQIESGSGVPNKTKVATISKADLQAIAEQKMPDLNAASVEAAMSMIAGTCRSMGVLIGD